MRSGIRISAAAAAIVLLAGCGGTTVHGTVPSPPPEVAVPHRPARIATPSATPSEERVYLQGPPAIAYQTQEGAATLQIRRFSWQRTANGQQAAPPQQHYVVLDIQITATEGTVPVNPLYFVGRTPGQTYAPTMGADGNEPVLASTDLGANQTVEGLIAFDAPRTQLTVQINDELGRSVGEVVVPAPPGPVEPVETPAGPVEAPAEPQEPPQD